MLLFEHNLLNTQLLSCGSEGHYFDEFFGHGGNCAEAIDKTFAISLQIGFKTGTARQII